MSIVAAVLTEDLVRTWAWALVHFTWQGTVLALIAAVVMRTVVRSARARYAVGVVTLGAMLAAPIATMLIAAPGGARPAPVVTADPAQPAAPAVEVDRAPAPASSTGPAAARPVPGAGWLMWIPVLWALGVTVCAVRVLGGWMAARRLVDTAVRPMADDLDGLVTHVARRIGVARPVRVLQSSAVSVPMVVGWVRAALLVPAATLAELSPAQLEALIAHELAHVRRHDYLVNLLQMVVETVLFYHPAVWWVSAQVRREREHCCDDDVVAVCDRLVYVSALTRLASVLSPAPVALAASDGSLLRRVRRLLGGEASRATPGWISALVLVFVLGGIVPAGLIATRAAGQDEPRPVEATPVVDDVRPVVTTRVPTPVVTTTDVVPVVSTESPAPVEPVVAPVRVTSADVVPAMPTVEPVTRVVSTATVDTFPVRVAVQEPLPDGATPRLVDVQVDSPDVQVGEDQERLAAVRARLAETERRIATLHMQQRDLEQQRQKSQLQAQIDAARQEVERQQRAVERMKATVEVGRADSSALDEAQAGLDAAQNSLRTLTNELQFAQQSSQLANQQEEMQRAYGVLAQRLAEAQERRQAEAAQGEARAQALQERAAVVSEQARRRLTSDARVSHGAPLAPDAAIQPGDILVVAIDGEENLPSTYVVDDVGSIRLPLLGPVAVAGLTASGAEGAISKQLADRRLASGAAVHVTAMRRELE